MARMAKVPGYPNVTSFVDAHGKTRYRYRRKDVAKSLPGRPGEPGFDAAYNAAISGQPIQTATVVAYPNATPPGTLGAAWRLVLRSAEWKQYNDGTRQRNRFLAEEWLTSRVTPGNPTTWQQVPIADLKRRHIKAVLSDLTETPHKAKHLLVAIRKIVRAAIDEDWIEHDPTTHIRWHPPIEGWRSWTRDEIDAFCSRWEPGTSARTLFSIALWLGLRRGDAVRLQWDQVDFNDRRVVVETRKNHKKAVLKMAPMLVDDLTAAPRRGPFVATTQYGTPYSEKSVSGKMRIWTDSAGLGPGCTLHGLRKTLGKLAAEGGASSRMSMDLLTHSSLAHAELYSRDAEQERLAADALDCAVRAFERRIG